jgi:hypothetical protein
MSLDPTDHSIIVERGAGRRSGRLVKTEEASLLSSGRLVQINWSQNKEPIGKRGRRRKGRYAAAVKSNSIFLDCWRNKEMVLG